MDYLFYCRSVVISNGLAYITDPCNYSERMVICYMFHSFDNCVVYKVHAFSQIRMDSIGPVPTLRNSFDIE